MSLEPLRRDVGKKVKNANLAIGFVLAMVVAGAMPSFAHAPKIGEHGGPQTNAGSFHVEIVPNGTRLKVYLREHSGKAVASSRGRCCAKIR